MYMATFPLINATKLGSFVNLVNKFLYQKQTALVNTQHTYKKHKEKIANATHKEPTLHITFALEKMRKRYIFVSKIFLKS